MKLNILSNQFIVIFKWMEHQIGHKYEYCDFYDNISEYDIKKTKFCKK